MGLSSAIKGRKSITAQTVRGLRRSHCRTEYILRLRLKHKQRDIGWRRIVDKTFSPWSRLTTRTVHHDPSALSQLPMCWQSAQDPVGDKRIIMLFWSTIDSAHWTTQRITRAEIV